jgi:hypothetical protein
MGDEVRICMNKNQSHKKRTVDISDADHTKEHAASGKKFILVTLISLLLPCLAVTQEKGVKI